MRVHLGRGHRPRTESFDAVAEAAVIRPTRDRTPAEARFYLESLPELWAKTSDAGRHAIAEVVFERICDLPREADPASARTRTLGCLDEVGVDAEGGLDRAHLVGGESLGQAAREEVHVLVTGSGLGIVDAVHRARARTGWSAP